MNDKIYFDKLTNEIIKEAHKMNIISNMSLIWTYSTEEPVFYFTLLKMKRIIFL